MTGLPYRPCPLILAAPSGTGKTTIAHALVERFARFVFSVSATTRPPRGDESDGVDYDFVSREAFEAMIEGGELLEWAEVHGNLYGTPRRNLEAAAARGEHVVLDIDVQGARQLRERAPEAVLIFVFPPSASALWGRLTARGTEAMDEVRRRLAAAQDELAEARHFDYIVVNDDLDRAISRVRAIVEAESHRPSRALDLEGELVRLRGQIDDVMRKAGA
ncbi:MAG: guanylate kinase [Gemmatimonadales bacterium]|nr:MAG: guanylate kinase [Gemmatimonadales bacterium]